MEWVFELAQDLEQLQEVVFPAAALDCSTKTIGPGDTSGFRRWQACAQAAPQRSTSEGLPNLPIKEQVRVSRDNLACDFILDELQALQDRGGSSMRENPDRSLNWELAQEKHMVADRRLGGTPNTTPVYGSSPKIPTTPAQCGGNKPVPDLKCHYSHDPGE